MKCNCCANTGKKSQTPAIVKTVDGKVIACGFLRFTQEHGRGSFVPIGRMLIVASFPEVAVEVTEKDPKNKFSSHIHRLRNWRLQAQTEKLDGETPDPNDQFQFDSEVE